MNDNIVKVLVASMICDKYYDRLRVLASSNMEDTEEYRNLLTKIKHCVKVENEEYHKLSSDEVLECLVKIDEDKINNPALPRHYSKLMHEMHIREGNISKKGILLSEAITTKLLIDILKKVEEKIKVFNNDDTIEESDVTIINIYHKMNKFNPLTANNYIESLAIKYNFEPSKIPTMHFTDMENNFNIEFVKEAKTIFLKYATDAIEEFLNLNDEDEYAKAYKALYDLARIECILDHLDKDALKTIQTHIDYNFIDNYDKETVKLLIKKRKEELNQ